MSRASKYDFQYEIVVKPTATEEEDKEPRAFVGLSNQGATCYMNSLLQTLFMTCEFRRNLFRWRFDPNKHGRKQDSIPFQLQLLFGRLQVGTQRYAETTGLTKSFQWDSHDAFEQHDVQEFCRVLFDAIETSVLGTAQERMINSLYEGVLIDYVKCQACGHESQREDKFMDLSLTVRNEFDKVYNKSLAEAIENYINAENLTGDNQYFCDQCKAKQDATKGLKLSRLPHILMLQLKRFDLDYETMQRKKLNDKVTFPLVLNMNPYVTGRKSMVSADEPDSDTEAKGESPTNPATEQPSGLDSVPMAHKVTASAEAIAQDSEKEPCKPETLAKEARRTKEAEARAIRNAELIEQYLREGPDVYELFSILIHSGSALGGHYYAYIKNWADSRWYNFNDSTVRGIDEEEIKTSFGGSSAKSQKYSSGANAYLLVYRRIRPDNLRTVDSSEIPDYIMSAMNEEKSRVEQESKRKEERQSQITLKVVYKGADRIMVFNKDQTLQEVKVAFLSEFSLVHIRPEDARIRDYQSHLDKLTECHDETQTLGTLRFYNYRPLALETKEPHEVFAPYDPNAMFIKVNVWSEDIALNDQLMLAQKTNDPVKVEVNKDMTIMQLMTRLQTLTKIPVERQKLVRKTYISTSTSVDVISSPSNRDKSLNAMRVYEGAVFFLEDLEKPMGKGKWEEELEKDQHRFLIKFNHPDEEPNAVGQLEYKFSVVVDSRKPLRVLKQHIAKQLGLGIDDFLIKRGSRHGNEMKDLEVRVTQCNLINGGVVYVEKGRPSQPDENKLRFFFATRPTAEVSDGTCYTFYDLAEIPISENCSILSMKETVCDRINALYPSMKLTPDRIRVREKNNDRLGKALHNSETLKSLTLFEKKQLCLQEIDDPSQEPAESDILLSVRLWSPSTWELSPVSDIVVKKNATMRELGEKLGEMYGIPLEQVEACRISYTWNFVRGDLVDDNWHKMGSNTLPLSHAPWYLTMDGSLIM